MLSSILKKEIDPSLLNLLFDSPDLILLVLDNKGNLVYSNTAFAEVFGLSSKEQPVNEALAVIHPEDHVLLKKNIAILTSGKSPGAVEMRMRSKHGVYSWFRFHARPLFSSGGEIGNFLVIGYDISDRKELEANLQEREERYRLVFNNASDLIWVIDLQGKILDISPSVESLFGYKPEELLGRRFQDIQLFTPESYKIALQSHSAVLQEEIPETSTFECITKAGEKKFGEVSSSPLIKEGKKIGMIFFLRDITERKHLYETALELNQIKTNLVTTAAHELKTPLTSILGWTEMFYTAKKKGVSLDATFDLGDFETVLRNCDRLLDLINDFLDVRQIEANALNLKPQKVEITPIIKDALAVVEFLANQKQITIKVNIDPSQLTIDPQRIEQVIVNLLSNALKYSPEKSIIHVLGCSKNVKGQKIYQIQVIDQGYGFLSEEIAVATQAFSRVHFQQPEKVAIKGTGLGLFICKNIIEQHKGTLSISSAGFKKGTTVTVELPFYSAF